MNMKVKVKHNNLEFASERGNDFRENSGYSICCPNSNSKLVSNRLNEFT